VVYEGVNCDGSGGTSRCTGQRWHRFEGMCPPRSSTHSGLWSWLSKTTTWCGRGLPAFSASPSGPAATSKRPIGHGASAWRGSSRRGTAWSLTQRGGRGQLGAFLFDPREVPRDVVEYVAEEPWTFSAELVLPLASARATVWEYGPGPGPFRSLANDWRGWDGERSYPSLEGQLHLSCRHDGKGLVEIRVTLRSPEPPKWSLSATINLGAGAHLERAADEIELFGCKT
jgi:hypothetical protein